MISTPVAHATLPHSTRLPWESCLTSLPELNGFCSIRSRGPTAGGAKNSKYFSGRDASTAVPPDATTLRSSRYQREKSIICNPCQPHCIKTPPPQPSFLSNHDKRDCHREHNLFFHVSSPLLVCQRMTTMNPATCGTAAEPIGGTGSPFRIAYATPRESAASVIVASATWPTSAVHVTPLSFV